MPNMGASVDSLARLLRSGSKKGQDLRDRLGVSPPYLISIINQALKYPIVVCYAEGHEAGRCA